jgi:hypothetical protein
MKITFTSLHQIDHLTDEIMEIDISTQSEDLRHYTDRLINEITTSTNKRQFKFKSDTTEVRTALSKYLDENFEEAAEINSNRLLYIEKVAQSKIAHLNKIIQKGSLFQAVLSDDDSTTIIISKADHSQFLDEVDFTIKNGLPWEKRIFRAFLVKFQEKNPPNIYVYDTTNRMARYWWDGYLELEEKFTDTHNTKTSLDVLDKKVFNKIKKDFPSDHTILRNSTIGYFRNKEEFELGEFLDETIREYKPVDSSFPKDKTISKIENLPEKWGFDSRFGIKKEEIKKRQVNNIPLSDKIELILKDHIDDLDNIITSEQDLEGTKFIKIKSTSGYERFKKTNENA